MKIARLSLEDGPRFGVYDETTDSYHLLTGDPLYSGIEASGKIVRAQDANLVAPILPRSKVVAIAGVYGKDSTASLENPPLTFLKPNTAVVGPNVPIVEPEWAGNLHHEVELAIIISRLCKDVPVERAQDVIFGYTVANDVTDVKTQQTDAQWARAKGFDTSCPLGPVINTGKDLDLDNLRLTLHIDGELVQEGNTADLAMSIPEIVAYVSSCFTLLPGDVILTGAVAPGVAGGPGSEVIAAIEGIGELRNPVLAS
ncbi:MAG: fumarylacetoacetate hydrolase family protein [Arcanobacterium sp.]|nr:fumarylacetoacetate hydrolase family protein [Arcanobacterium sp.]